jgi:prepilin-type N-terminal cleavage/methylation domain-containing protein
MNNKGFTLAEVLVTIGILGIMAAISIPSYFSWLPKHKLKTSVRQIYDDLNLAKMLAVKNNTNAVVKFSTLNNSYSIFLDTKVANFSLDAGEPEIRKGATLEKDVNIYQTTLTSNSCAFNNRALAVNTGQIYMTSPSGLYMGVDLNAAGNISIITSNDHGGTWKFD